MCPSVCLEIPCNVLSSNKKCFRVIPTIHFCLEKSRAVVSLKKKIEEKERKKTAIQAWRLMKVTKEACTFIVNIPRSYSSNLKLEMSRLLRGSLRRISVPQLHRDRQLYRRVGEQGGDIWLLFDVNIKSTTSLLPKSSSLLRVWDGEVGEAKLGTFCKYLLSTSK